MITEQIKNILEQRGYTERNAVIASKELAAISKELSTLLDSWLADENNQQDFSIHGKSIRGFLQEGMKYPAALLTMDWLIKEPESAIRSLTKGHR